MPSFEPEDKPELRGPMPRRSRGGGLFHFLFIVGGGFAGLALGYYGLNYFGGPRFNMFEIALPGIPHTQPGWVDPKAAAKKAPADRSGAKPTGVHDDLPQANPGETAGTFDPPEGDTKTLPPTPPESPRHPLVRSRQPVAAAAIGPALASANAALGCPDCNSTGRVKKIVTTGQRVINGKTIATQREVNAPCERCGGKPGVQVNTASLAELAKLGETLALVDGSDPEVQRRADGVESVFKRVATKPETLAQAERLSSEELAAAPFDRAAVIVGRVTEVSVAGPFHLYRVKALGGQQLTLASMRPLGSLKVGVKTLAAGALVAEPANNLTNYPGEERMLLLVGYYYWLP